MKLSLGQILFASLPQSFLLIYVCLGLYNIKTSLWDNIKITLIYMISLFSLRNLFNMYGLHTFILILLLIVIFKLIIKVDWKVAIISSVSGFSLLMIGNSLVLPFVVNYLQISVKQIMQGGLIQYLLIAHLVNLPLWLTAIVIYYWDFNIFNLSERI
ncbi:hypothetical protein Halha_2602 [Halobacteroides halobius DSM 5150]|uniref:Uncharacterized protein n=1 Tax=Halobacteroides halobius (strain ATCC 35273 / DSM 5150 / MD-1) TaxID=748449 RepID=L0KD50_HALHC|nr:hypothetical protein [Halobacteroides halobius]AGB42475.1 hypothetical protein Halha_2602 [Halobacteroides halobius DSM 5150]